MNETPRCPPRSVFLGLLLMLPAVALSAASSYRLTGRPEYYDVFCQTLDFVEKHQVAREGSRWATRTADGSPKSDQRASPWHGGYRSGRAMLRCAELLEELAGAR